MRDLGEFVLVMLLVIGVPGAMLFGAVYWAEQYQCSVMGGMVERESHYVGLTCYIRDNGVFVPKKQYEKAYEQNLNLKVKP